MSKRVSLLLLLAVFLGPCRALLYAQAPVSSSTPTPQPGLQTLTIAQAEQLALQHNPQVSYARLIALAQGQQTREVRSREMPQAVGDITAVDSHANSRLTAGGLNNPIVYQRAAGGVMVSQLISDFGRTRNLVASARFDQQSQEMASKATTADIILTVDEAFYHALNAQALVTVAQDTVSARQDLADRVSALTKAKLKSELDLSFANVNLAQAQLLMLDAQNEAQDSMLALKTLLGDTGPDSYKLVDEAPETPTPPNTDIQGLLSLAMKSRPDLASLELQYQSSLKFRNAERDLWRPSITALVASGDAPVRADQISPWYAAAGVNLQIPIFNGFAYSARAKAAEFRSSAMQEKLRDFRNVIVRDVSMTALQAESAYQKIAVSKQLLSQANLALDLAKTRYQLGLGTIVELSQAQLQQTEAAIGYENARYAYQAVQSALRYQTGQ